MGKLALFKTLIKIKNVKFLGLRRRDGLRKKLVKKYKIKNSYSSHKGLIADIKNYDGIVIITKEHDRSITGILKFGNPYLLRNRWQEITNSLLDY